MTGEFYSIGVLILVSAMLPGADFVMVTKNTLLHSRRAGLFTSLGIASGLIVHATYCILGLAVLISQSLLLFSIVKYLGAAYLFYLGFKMIREKNQNPATNIQVEVKHKTDVSASKAFIQGFLTNVLNPKCSMVFLAIFTMVIKPDTPFKLEAWLTLEMFLIVFFWFAFVTLIFSHQRLQQGLRSLQQHLNKIFGGLLIGFGVCLAMVKNQ